jgi:hypothetical protein
MMGSQYLGGTKTMSEMSIFMGNSKIHFRSYGRAHISAHNPQIEGIA